jgi:hypothetical protein
MDSLHLFTIPRWLPENLPPELWAIIFYWKWRLEMKDIHIQLTDYTSFQRYGGTAVPEEWGHPAAPMTDYISPGNIWYKITPLPPPKQIIVREKCGIELLNKKFWWSPFPDGQNKRPFNGNKVRFKKYLYENHGIVMPETNPRANKPFTIEWYEDWKYLIKLLRTD